MSATGAAARRRLTGRALPATGLLLTLATIITGLALKFIAGVTLGTTAPPLSIAWQPRLRAEALIAIGVCAAVVTLTPRAIERVRSGFPFAALAYLAALGVGLAVNAARDGVSGWTHVFAPHTFESRFEYLPGLPSLRGGVAHYVRHFAQLLPDLPTHVKGNPPGPLVVMHLLSLDTPDRLAAACIAVGALSAPLAYALGRELSDERRGRVAAVLTALAPSAILWGVTSVDYAFAALGTAVAWLLVSRRPSARTAGGVLAAIASFQSWLLLAIPVWAVLCVWRRDGRRAAVAVAVISGVAIGAFTLVLHLLWGYDPIADVRALAPIYAHGMAHERPYAFWLFGSPAAFAAMLGLPTAWLALRACARGEPAALALMLVIAVSAVAGFTKAETERIWLPFVPLACVAAAAERVRRPTIVLACLAAQAIVIEILFVTTW